MTSTRFLIAVCTQNRKSMLQRCVLEVDNSIKRVDKSLRIRVLIIDNSANKNMLEIFTDLKSKCKTPILYSNVPNPGLANARNEALSKRERGEALIFIDDDEWPDQNWLMELIAASKCFPESIIGGLVIPVFPYKSGSYLEKFQIRSTGWVGSCGFGNVLIPPSILDNTFLSFDSRYNFSGGEDTDFCMQAKEFGYSVYYISEAKCFEEWSETRATRRAILCTEFQRSSVLTDILLKHRKGRVRMISVSIIKILASILILPKILYRRDKLDGSLIKMVQGLGAIYGLKRDLNAIYATGKS